MKKLEGYVVLVVFGLLIVLSRHTIQKLETLLAIYCKHCSWKFNTGITMDPAKTDDKSRNKGVGVPGRKILKARRTRRSVVESLSLTPEDKARFTSSSVPAVSGGLPAAAGLGVKPKFSVPVTKFGPLSQAPRSPMDADDLVTSFTVRSRWSFIDTMTPIKGASFQTGAHEGVQPAE